jgi:predicted benzoate:H+ symporter BenE
MLPLSLMICSACIRYFEIIISGQDDMTGSIFSWSVGFLAYIVFGYFWKRANVATVLLLLYASSLVYFDITMGNLSFKYANQQYGLEFPESEFSKAMPVFLVVIVVQMLVGMFIGQYLYNKKNNNRREHP